MTLRPHSPKGRTRTDRAAAAKRLMLAVSDLCDWCGSREGADLHHVAGRAGDLIDDARFCLILCRPCHQTIEERVMGADSTALGLALLRHRCGASVREYWHVTGREYPLEGLVEAWSKRILREGR